MGLEEAAEGVVYGSDWAGLVAEIEEQADAECVGLGVLQCQHGEGSEYGPARSGHGHVESIGDVYAGCHSEDEQQDHKVIEDGVNDESDWGVAREEANASLEHVAEVFLSVAEVGEFSAVASGLGAVVLHECRGILVEMESLSFHGEAEVVVFVAGEDFGKAASSIVAIAAQEHVAGADSADMCGGIGIGVEGAVEKEEVGEDVELLDDECVS